MGFPANELTHLESGSLCQLAEFQFGIRIELLVLVPSFVSTWKPVDK